MQLWRAIDAGKPSSQDRIDAVTLAGELRAVDAVGRVRALVHDSDEMVRYFALQALVLDLGQKNGEVEALCWNVSETDSSDDVKAMAVTCLGSILFGSRRTESWSRLMAILKSGDAPDSSRAAAYNALFKVAGLPPSEWPGVVGPASFDAGSINWRRLAEIEASLGGQ
jgi:hypothetical protein